MRRRTVLGPHGSPPPQTGSVDEGKDGPVGPPIVPSGNPRDTRHTVLGALGELGQGALAIAAGLANVDDSRVARTPME